MSDSKVSMDVAGTELPLGSTSTSAFAHVQRRAAEPSCLRSKQERALRQRTVPPRRVRGPDPLSKRAEPQEAREGWPASACTKGSEPWLLASLPAPPRDRSVDPAARHSASWRRRRSRKRDRCVHDVWNGVHLAANRSRRWLVNLFKQPRNRVRGHGGAVH